MNVQSGCEKPTRVRQVLDRWLSIALTAFSGVVANVTDRAPLLGSSALVWHRLFVGQTW